jgi:hypothetical protein
VSYSDSLIFAARRRERTLTQAVTTHRSEDGQVLAERRAIFCRQLKAARQKSGVTLEAIAASTKVRRSLFVDLERNELSRWPKGVYRRAYLREYLRAIDLDDESMVDEFTRLFPDDEDEKAILHSERPAPALKMTLADDRVESFERLRARVVTAIMDVMMVGTAWATIAWVSGADISTVGVIVVLAYFTCATAWVGRTPAAELIESVRRRGLRHTPEPPEDEPLLARFDSMTNMPDPPDPFMTDALS